ncbi:DedA family protein [Microcella daejeonensis]|uniref:DedA family protein n=1 Tax=Microcella daejeonensis TaxID=2994971 RepID=UPI00226DEE2B|nr:DedA family protein [Microcella daejeonensis]WAB84399.1 DedA family protein [Microcella daejeonensis]
MGIDEWAVAIMESLGLFGAGLLVAIESIFPPIPSEIILPLAGFTASQGSFTIVGAILATTLGSIVGAVALYYLGQGVGAQRLRRWAEKVPLMSADDVDKAMVWFHRHGKTAVFTGRFVPIVRSLVSIPAGVDRMPLPIFILLTTLGSGLWNSLFVILGFVLGENWTAVEQFMGTYSRGILVIAIIAVLAVVVVRIRKRRRAG